MLWTTGGERSSVLFLGFSIFFRGVWANGTCGRIIKKDVYGSKKIFFVLFEKKRAETHSVLFLRRQLLAPRGGGYRALARVFSAFHSFPLDRFLWSSCLPGVGCVARKAFSPLFLIILCCSRQAPSCFFSPTAAGKQKKKQRTEGGGKATPHLRFDIYLSTEGWRSSLCGMEAGSYGEKKKKIRKSFSCQGLCYLYYCSFLRLAAH